MTYKIFAFIMRMFFPKLFKKILDDYEIAEERMFWFGSIGIDRPIDYYLEQLNDDLKEK